MCELCRHGALRPHYRLAAITRNMGRKEGKSWPGPAGHKVINHQPVARMLRIYPLAGESEVAALNVLIYDTAAHRRRLNAETRTVRLY